MINGFSYNVYVPSLRRSVRYSELNSMTYMVILKYIQNDDDDGLEHMLEHLIEQLCVEKINMKKLTRLDKYCIVMTMIMVCVGNTLQYNILCPETDKEYMIDIVLGNIISQINEIDVTDLRVDLDEHNYITMTTPGSIRGPITNTLSQVCINNKTYDVTGLTDDQLNGLFDKLPYNIFSELQQTYRNISKQCDDIVYMQYKSPYVKDSREVKYRFNLYNDEFFKFIKLLLREDLLNYYKMYYSLTTKFKFDITYIQSITPTEIKMYLGMVRDDIKKKQEQLEQSTGKQNQNLPVSAPRNDMDS